MELLIRSRARINILAFLVCFSLLSVAQRAAAYCELDGPDVDTIPDGCPSGYNYVAGTSGADAALNGTGGSDCIYGFGGNDTINAGNGNDYVCGGNGDDTIVGSNGADQLYGEDGADNITGVGDADTINGGAGNDTLDGGNQSDVVDGGADNDVVNGGGSNDVLYGGSGDDSLDGGNGSDILSGGPIGLGTDTLDGGGSNDTCVEEVAGTTTRLTSCETRTWVFVGEFVALRGERGETVLQWTTIEEHGALGFQLQRWDAKRETWVSVSSDPIPAGFHEVDGATYSVVDRGWDGKGSARYRLLESTLQGEQNSYGPYLVQVSSHPSALSSAPVQRAIKKRSLLQRTTRHELKSALPRLMRDESPVAVFAKTSAEGVYKISATELASALNFSPGDLQAAIEDHALKISTAAGDQAWDQDSGHNNIYVVADHHQNAFIKGRAFRVEVGAGASVAQRLVASIAATETSTYRTTQRMEENNFSALAALRDPRDEQILWKVLASISEALSSYTVPVVLSNVDHGGADALLKIRVYGTQSSDDETLNKLKVSFAGAERGEFEIARGEFAELSIPISASELAEGTNPLVLEALPTSSGAMSVMYLDRVSIDYDRAALAQNDQLVGAFEAGDVVVDGLTTDQVLVYDVSDAQHPVRLSGFEISASNTGYRLAFSLTNSTRLVIETLGTIESAQIDPVYRKLPTDAAEAHDFWVVTAPQLLLQAQQLADHRREQGLSSTVVVIDDIYNAYRNGEPDPQALRDLLLQAQSQSKAPKYIVLLGRGTADYRNDLGYNDTLIAPLLNSTDQGLYAGDMLSGDLDNDGMPEVAIGRLPFLNAGEFDHWFASMRQREEDLGTNPILFSSDASDDAKNYEQAAQNLGALLPAGSRAQYVSLQSTAVDVARSAVLNSWQEGLSWMFYVGHSGMDRLSSQGLLMQDESMLPTAGAGTILVAWTCNVARFELPGYDSLGSYWLSRDTENPSAIWSSTGPSVHESALEVAKYFVDQAFVQKRGRLGDAILFAYHDAADQGASDLSNRYALLGDPAMKINAQALDKSASKGGCALTHSADRDFIMFWILLSIALGIAWRRGELVARSLDR